MQTTLVRQRDFWKSQYEKGEKYPFMLTEYKKIRDSEGTRLTVALEEVLEYAIHLENKMKGLENGN